MEGVAGERVQVLLIRLPTVVLEQIEVVLGHKQRGGKWEHTFTGEVYKVLLVVLKEQGRGYGSILLCPIPRNRCLCGWGRENIFSFTYSTWFSMR